MQKVSIALYTSERIPMSLGNLLLYHGKFVEDLFDAVEDSEDFDELTNILRTVIDEPLVVDRVTDRYIRYKIIDPYGNVEFLKIKVKKEEQDNG